MKTITLTFAILLSFSLQSIAQVNPVQNLNWEHWYEYPNNFFILSWEEPEQPHDAIVGYNIYRENDFYLFISNETSIYNVNNSVHGIVSNCGGEDFLFYNGGGFFAHVTAVYSPGNVESDYTETVFITGPLLEIKDFKSEKPMIYPNPSNGVMNVKAKNLEVIMIYDSSGKKIRELKANSHIDLTGISKGIYFIKLISEDGVFVDKIILE